MPIENSGPASLDYGDIVRDDDTKQDFVIIGLGSAVGGWLIYEGMDAFTKEFKTWRIAEQSQKAPLTLIRKNYKGETAEEIGNRIEQTYLKASKSIPPIEREKFFEKLFSPEGAPIRSWLTMGNDLTPTGYSKDLTKLAKGLIGIGVGSSSPRLTSEEIFDALSSNLPSEAYDEATLRYISDDLANHIQTAIEESPEPYNLVKEGKKMFSSVTASSDGLPSAYDLLLNVDSYDEKGQSAFRRNTSLSDQGNKTGKFLKDVFLGGLNPKAKGILASIGGSSSQFKAVGNISTEGAAENLANLYRNVFTHLTGASGDTNDGLQKLIDKAAKKDIEILKKLNGKALNVDAMSGYFKQLVRVLESEGKLAMEGKESHSPQAWISKVFEQAETTLDLPVTNKQTVRASTRTGGRANPFKLNTELIKRLRKNQGGLEDYFSISVEALMDALPKASVKFEGVDYSLKSAVQAGELMDKLQQQSNQGAIIVKGTDIEKLVKDPSNLDLTGMVAESNAATARLSDEAKMKLQLTHGLKREEADRLGRFKLSQQTDNTPSFSMTDSSSPLLRIDRKDIEVLTLEGQEMAREVTSQKSPVDDMIESLSEAKSKTRLTPEDMTSLAQKQQEARLLKEKAKSNAKNYGPIRTISPISVETVEEAYEKGLETQRLSFHRAQNNGEIRAVLASTDNVRGSVGLEDMAERVLSGDKNLRIAYFDMEYNPSQRTFDELSILTAQTLDQIKDSSKGPITVEGLQKALTENRYFPASSTNTINDQGRRHDPAAKKFANFRKHTTTVDLGQLDEIVGYLEKQDVIISHNNADLTFLHSMVQDSSDPKAVELKKRILKLIEEKSLPSEYLHMKAGLTNPALWNQAYLTRKILQEEQVHGAAMDNLHSSMILDTIKGSKHADLIGFDELAEEGLFINFEDTSFEDLRGSTAQILGIEDRMSGRAKDGINPKFDYRVTLKMQNGFQRVMEFNSHELGGFLGNSRLLTGDAGKELFDQAIPEDNVNEMVERFIRGINPDTIYSELATPKYLSEDLMKKGAGQSVWARSLAAKTVAAGVYDSVLTDVKYQTFEEKATDFVASDVKSFMMQKYKEGELGTYMKEVMRRSGLDFTLDESYLETTGIDTMYEIMEMMDSPVRKEAVERFAGLEIVKSLAGFALSGDGRKIINPLGREVYRQVTSGEKILKTAEASISFGLPHLIDESDPIVALAEQTGATYDPVDSLANKLTHKARLDPSDGAYNERQIANALDNLFVSVGGHRNTDTNSAYVKAAKAIEGFLTGTDSEKNLIVRAFDEGVDGTLPYQEYKQYLNNELAGEGLDGGFRQLGRDLFFARSKQTEDMVTLEIDGRLRVLEQVQEGNIAVLNNVDVAAEKDALTILRNQLAETVKKMQDEVRGKSAEDVRGFKDNLARAISDVISDFAKDGDNAKALQRKFLDDQALKTLSGMDWSRDVITDEVEGLLENTTLDLKKFTLGVFDEDSRAVPLPDAIKASAQEGLSEAQLMLEENASTITMAERLQKSKMKASSNAVVDSVDNVAEFHSAVTSMMSEINLNLPKGVLPAVGALAAVAMLGLTPNLESAQESNSPSLKDNRTKRMSINSSSAVASWDTQDKTPFRLNMSIDAFVDGEHEKERIIQSVYSSYANKTINVAVNQQTRDLRDKKYEQSAYSIARL